GPLVLAGSAGLSGMCAPAAPVQSFLPVASAHMVNFPDVVAVTTYPLATTGATATCPPVPTFQSKSPVTLSNAANVEVTAVSGSTGSVKVLCPSTAGVKYEETTPSSAPLDASN